MAIVTRTIYGSQVQTSKFLGLDHEILEFTTVNEVLLDPLRVPYQPSQPTRGMDVAPAYNYENDTDALHLQYMVIGNGGHLDITGAVNNPGGLTVPTTTPIEHLSTDAALYNMIPFVVVPATNDLSTVDRQKYRLRKTMEINGDLFIAYYARRIDLSVTAAETIVATVSNGTVTATPFVPNINNLRPVRPVISSTNTSADYTSVTAPMPINFTTQEAAWLADACELLYGSPDLALISEIGYCTGVDKAITQRYPQSGTQTPTTITGNTYKEAVGVQIAIHVTMVPLSVASLNAGVGISYDAGISEPLFGKRS